MASEIGQTLLLMLVVAIAAPVFLLVSTFVLLAIWSWGLESTRRSFAKVERDEVRTCPHCKTQFKPEVVFCPGCGKVDLCNDTVSMCEICDGSGSVVCGDGQRAWFDHNGKMVDSDYPTFRISSSNSTTSATITTT